MLIQGYLEDGGGVFGAGHVYRRLNPPGSVQHTGNRSIDALGCYGARIDHLERAFVGQKIATQGLLTIVNRVAMAAKFERVIVLDDGRLAEQGTFEELDKDGTALRGLLETA